MNRITTIALCLILFIFTGNLLANSNRDFSEIYTAAEENPAIMVRAKMLAMDQGLPVSIFTTDNLFIHTIAVENNTVLYAIISNLAHPFQNGKIAAYREFSDRIDLSTSRVYYGNGRFVNEDLGLPSSNARAIMPGDSLLLIPDWSDDRVMAFDPYSGDLIDYDFIPMHSTELASPKEARQTPRNYISVSDQIRDLVQQFDTSGTYIGILAPAGGVHNDTLDNIRGHAFRPNGNLVVTVASGANADAIAEFDDGGIYLGNFIANGAGGLDGPFSILFRTNDVLVTSDGSDQVLRYDLNGSFLNVFASASTFPQQIVELPNGDIAVANFSGQTGVLIFSSTGTFQRLLSGVTGNRGAWQLGNGDIMTTNSAGVYELNPTSGTVIRTIATGVNAQFIELYSASMPTSAEVVISAKIGGDSQYRKFWVNGSWDANGNYDPMWSGPLVALNDSANYPDAVAGDSIFSGSVQLAIDSMNTYNWWLGSENDLGSFLDDGTGFNVMNANPVYTDTLVVDGDGGINQWVVALPGDFNGWDNTNDMTRTGTVWSQQVHLTAGTYEYKFAVMHQWGAAYGDGGIGGGIPNYSYVAANEGDFLFEFDDSNDSASVTPVVGLDPVVKQLPQKFLLTQNYPNPFNPTTTIEYQLANQNPQHTTLRIYNIAGQLVRTLVDDDQKTGEYTVVWNGLDNQGHETSSGVYFYRLTSGDFVQTKKLLKMK